MLAKIVSIIDKINENIAKAFSYLILVIIALETYEVFLRYILGSPTSWTWEVATHLYGALFMIGGAWVLKENRHVRTDVIYGRLSHRKRAIFDIIMFGTIYSTFVGVLCWKTINGAIKSWIISETSWTFLALPLYPIKIIIALSFILLTLQGVAKMIRDIVFVWKGVEL